MAVMQDAVDEDGSHDPIAGTNRSFAGSVDASCSQPLRCLGLGPVGQSQFTGRWCGNLFPACLPGLFSSIPTANTLAATLVSFFRTWVCLRSGGTTLFEGTRSCRARASQPSGSHLVHSWARSACYDDTVIASMSDYTSASWAASSAGRARRSQCRGHGFDPRAVHQASQ